MLGLSLDLIVHASGIIRPVERETVADEPMGQGPCRPQPRLWEWQGRGTLLLSTKLDREPQIIKGPTLLRADEGVVIALEK